MKQKTISTKKIVLTALLAALTVAGSACRISVPSAMGFSYFHLGNIICALAGILLGPVLGGLAAGLGSALYDIFFPQYFSECWITFLTKGILGAVAGLVAWRINKPWHCKVSHSTLRAVLGAVFGALTYAVLYLVKVFLYDGMIIANLTANGALIKAVTTLPATIFNATVAVVAAPLLAITISAALKQARLDIHK